MTLFNFIRRLATITATTASILNMPALAEGITEFPGFQIQNMTANGTTLHVRVGGTGPAVVLLHGYGDTGDMWGPMAADLARDHMVIVPDLRGLGLSAISETGFEKANQAKDIAGVMDTLQISRADVVAHDIGNMVAYAFAARFPDRVTKLVLMDAPVPGIGAWDDIIKNPLLWHFRFGGPDMERLVAGRERIYLDRFWNDFSADPKRFQEDHREHYAKLYALPGRMHAGFRQFAAFDQDAVDNRAWLAAHGKLRMPVLAIGGEKSFGSAMGTVTRAGAANVEEQVIVGAGHWLMEEQPARTVKAVRKFLDTKSYTTVAGQLTPYMLSLDQVASLPVLDAGTGTSGHDGIHTVLLYGNPAQPGPYALEIRVPAHTTIASHTHRDDRFASVISGTWYFGFGDDPETARITALGAGGIYTEPSNAPHFASTRDEPAVVRITGYGPSGTSFDLKKNSNR